MTRRDWSPLGTRSERGRPTVGGLIARDHAVWRVGEVTDVDPTDEEQELLKHPWYAPPYRVVLTWIAGAPPSWADRTPTLEGRIRIGTVSRFTWQVYPDGRWPQCSCCGEPMPCRATLREREVREGARRVEELLSVPDGACWGCREPITSRQKWQAYPGENLDLPGGQEVRFHTRGQCRRELLAYEGRWLAVDPRRERVYTWPTCQGWLVVHADGSSECEQGPVWPHANISGDPHPDCRGHLTHDHGNRRACDGVDGGHCPRGCTPEGHNGTWVHPERPDRHP